MQPHANSSPVLVPERGESIHWAWAAVTSPWLWGVALSVAFYSAIPYLPIEREFVARYFAGHWIEYATTGLFLIGMCILGQKAVGLWAERAALQQSKGLPLDPGLDLATPDRACLLWVAVAAQPPRLRRTQLAERIREVCHYVQSRKGAAAVEDHLKYLAELASGSLHGSYALVRTVTWAIPILGFLGTVIGITMAIANVTPEQLGSSLGEVTSGLAVAFDTTALSLALSMVLVFSTFLVEKAEGQIMSQVEDFGTNHLATCFAESPSEQSPWAAAEAEAARQLLHSTEGLIARQTALWQGALEDMRSRWLQTAEKQQSGFVAALQQGMTATLNSHAQQLGDMRQEFLAAVGRVAEELSRVGVAVQDASRSQQDAFSTRVGEMWQQAETQVAALRQDQQAHTRQTVALLTDAMAHWEHDLSAASTAMSGQLQELVRQGEVLRSIAEQEERLVRLQTTLDKNLQTVQTLEAFEETIHSLNAVAHLLTVRTRAHAA